MTYPPRHHTTEMRDHVTSEVNRISKIADLEEQHIASDKLVAEVIEYAAEHYPSHTVGTLCSFLQLLFNTESIGRWMYS